MHLGNYLAISEINHVVSEKRNNHIRARYRYYDKICIAGLQLNIEYRFFKINKGNLFARKKLRQVNDV